MKTVVYRCSWWNCCCVASWPLLELGRWRNRLGRDGRLMADFETRGPGTYLFVELRDILLDAVLSRHLGSGYCLKGCLVEAIERVGKCVVV